MRNDETTLTPYVKHNFQQFKGFFYVEEFESFHSFSYVEYSTTQKICKFFGFKSGTLEPKKPRFLDIKIYKTIYCDNEAKNLSYCHIIRNRQSSVILSFKLFCSMDLRKNCSGKFVIGIKDFCFFMILQNERISAYEQSNVCKRNKLQFPDFSVYERVPILKLYKTILLELFLSVTEDNLPLGILGFVVKIFLGQILIIFQIFKLQNK